MQPTRESKLEPMPCVLLWVKGRGTHQLLQKPHMDLGNVRFSKLDSRVIDCDCWGEMPIQVRSVITSGFTGHEQTSNHFTPARVSAPRATLCYPPMFNISPSFCLNCRIVSPCSPTSSISRSLISLANVLSFSLSSLSTVFRSFAMVDSKC